MLKPETVSRFKSLFEQQKRNLLYSQEFVNEDFHIQKDDLLDDMDLTANELERSMRMRLRNREALFLKKIDEALERIASGSFGECEDCGDQIDLRRLEARPTSTFCMGCKEEQEKREFSHIDGHKAKSLGARLRLA